MNDHTGSKFRDLTTLSEWIKALLLLEVVATTGALGSELYALSLIDQLRLGGENAFRIVDEVTARELKIAWGQAVIYLFAGVLILVWIYRMNTNARALGAEGMKFTPGWAVGWYFIPIANLWKPYQAMKEIWQATADPRDWANQLRPPLLPLWWGLWIATISMNRGATGLTRRVETIDDWQRATMAWVASDLFHIALDVVVILLVLRLMALQKASMERLGVMSPP